MQMLCTSHSIQEQSGVERLESGSGNQTRADPPAHGGRQSSAIL